MNKNIFKRVLRSWLFVIVYGMSTGAIAANDRAFFWKVTPVNPGHNDSVVYLLGSVHFADATVYPMRKEITDAFESSKNLVVEIDINKTDHNAMQQLMAKRGNYTDGTTLQDVLSEETWLQLRQRLKLLGIPYDNVKHYKPGLLVLVLTSAQVIQMGFSPDYGIDMHFLKKADADGKQKNVIELETVEQQLDMLLGIPDAELLLQETLYQLDEAELLMNDMMRYWRTGNEDMMQKMLFDDALKQNPSFDEIYQRLFYRRNAHMTSRIEAMLKQGGRYFVVVGTGHLVGDNGIVNTLKQSGFRVERQ